MTALEHLVLDVLRETPNLEIQRIQLRLGNHPGTRQVVEKLAAAGSIEPCDTSWDGPVEWQVAQ